MKDNYFISEVYSGEKKYSNVHNKFVIVIFINTSNLSNSQEDFYFLMLVLKADKDFQHEDFSGFNFSKSL